MKNNTCYFPFFISLDQKKIRVYGAGTIALRRIDTLLPFRPQITVIAPEIPEELPPCYTTENISWQRRQYQSGEIDDCFFVLAATNDTEVNHAIYRECRTKQIPVNNASDQTECDFFFPAIVQKGDIIIGLSSGGKDHAAVRDMAAYLRTEQINIRKDE